MHSFAQRHPLLWAYLFFLYFSVVYQLLVYSSGMSGLVGVRQSLLMSVLWLIPLLLWPKRSKLLAAGIGLVLWAASLVGVGYWLIYGQDFSQSAIFIIFESNPAEGNEFILSYLRWWHPFVFLSFSLIPVLMWRLMSPMILKPRSRAIYAVVFSLVVGWPFLNTLLIRQQGSEVAYYHLEKRLEPTAPWNLVVGYLHYQNQLADMEMLLNKNRSLSAMEDLKIDASTAPDTLVLVIGESTNGHRMSLYGYERDTTPKLNAIRDELVVFNDVISPRPYTIEALQQVLSFADSKHPDAFFDQPTLLNIMKQAGYDITWITNQQTQTRRNTMLTTLSQMADHQVYLNNNREQNASQFDGEVISPFEAALTHPADKKMIVIHLLGTHRGYDNRYPQNFETFVDHDNAPAWVKAGDLYDYNSYDNAVSYNDYVVSELISRLRQQQGNALLIYFSDHGEEVHDTPGKPFSGRNEGAPTPAMYTVPFITWASADFKANHEMGKWNRSVDRPFSSADFIYTLADMMGINFKGMDYSRSLISEQFVQHPRWIGNPLSPGTLQDYDKIDWKYPEAQPVLVADKNSLTVGNKL
jgi:heptose-I-phosphate ethanolaminephosphotransferase